MFFKFLIPLFIVFFAVPDAHAKPYTKFREPNLTKKYTKEAENAHNLPENILLAIAHYESNRSPYAINAKGRGYFFKTKEEAAEFVEKLVNEGVHNINVGFMQLNYPSHRKRFKSVGDMLDVKQNIFYAAKLLKSLHKKTGDWEKAVELYKGGYSESSTSYRKKIFTLRFKLPKINLKDFHEEKYAITVAFQKIDHHKFFMHALGPKKANQLRDMSNTERSTAKGISLKSLSTNFKSLNIPPKESIAFGRTFARIHA